MPDLPVGGTHLALGSPVAGAWTSSAACAAQATRARVCRDQTQMIHGSSVGYRTERIISGASRGAHNIFGCSASVWRPH